MMRCWFIGFLAAAICGCGRVAGPNPNETSIEELNRAFSVMAMKAGHPPATLDELTNFPSIRGRALPKAPAGKRLAIDRQANQVIFTEQ